MATSACCGPPWTGRCVGGCMGGVPLRSWAAGHGAGIRSRSRLVLNETEASPTAHFASVQQAGLTVATAVTLGSGPVLVTIGARLALGERSGAAGTVAVASGVAGLVLLMGGADGSTGPAPLLGIGYALLSAAGYAGVTLLGRFAGREKAGGAFESTVTGFAVGTVCLLPTALLEGILPDMERPAWTAGPDPLPGGRADGAGVPVVLRRPLRRTGDHGLRRRLGGTLTAAVVGSLVFGERLNAIVLTGRVLLPLAVLFRAADERVGRAASRRAPSADHGQRTWPPAIRAGD